MPVLDYAPPRKPRRLGLWLSLPAILFAAPILTLAALDAVVFLIDRASLAGEFDRPIRQVGPAAIPGILLAIAACFTGAPRLGTIAALANALGILFFVGRIWFGWF